MDPTNDSTPATPQPGATAGEFVFITCQRGAEKALKQELALAWPAWRLAFSRPGWLTMKLPPGHGLAADFALHSVFSRSHGFAIGKAAGEMTAARVEAVVAAAQAIEADAIHAWPREGLFPRRPLATDARYAWLPPLLDQLEHAARRAGIPLFSQPLPELAEPIAASVAAEAASDDTTELDGVAARDDAQESSLDGSPNRSSEGALVELPDSALVEPADAGRGRSQDEGYWDPRLLPENWQPLPEVEPPTPRGQRVLDCVFIEPETYWLGHHLTRSGSSRWPGGMQIETMPPHAVSRAYLKMREALRWSKLPVQPGDICVEFGSAPGGAAQALLERGLRVSGVDPAPMHPAVLAHPNFRWIRKRAKEVRRRYLSRTRWLVSDMNVAPNYTLDCVADFAQHPEVSVEGLLLTLKLPDWELGLHIGEFLDRVRSWGFRDVRAKQLIHNRQEICVAAIRRKKMR